ncbi:MAG: hypothetical protein OXP69_03640 [Spirochaetaceae bacterium]|nr:hypothetical protein [Spirochaetaceae bacterium]
MASFVDTNVLLYAASTDGMNFAGVVVENPFAAHRPTHPAV